MAVKHKTISPVRGVATANTASDNYVVGGDPDNTTIKQGAPVVAEQVSGTATGKVIELGDSGSYSVGDDTVNFEGSQIIIGFADHDAASGQPLKVTPALPNQRFIGSLGNSDGGNEDIGDHALALEDLLHDATDAAPYVLAKDATTGKWYVDVDGSSSEVQVVVCKLLDPAGATTDDDASGFGAVGDPTLKNSGLAQVEFFVCQDSTIYSLENSSFYPVLIL